MTSGGGTKQPPHGTRFKKGESGNPKGRPKRRAKTAQTSAFDIVVDRTLTIHKGGRLQEVSVEEALQHQTYRKAIEGDKLSRREVLKMIRKREAYLEKHDVANQWQPPKRLLEPADPDNANHALLILGIVSVDETRAGFSGHKPAVNLEPWAVQAALSRRRGGTKLTDREVREIQRCTRDSGSIRWPRGAAR
jgi:hypothetical protein